MRGMVSAADWMQKHGTAESAKEVGAWMKEAAKGLASAAAKNVLDATPLTREGMSKGLGTITAELRGGLLDLQKAVVQAFPDSQQQETVLGMIGVPTPGMVDRAADMPLAVELKEPAANDSARKSVLGYELVKPEQGNDQQQEMSRGR